MRLWDIRLRTRSSIGFYRLFDLINHNAHISPARICSISLEPIAFRICRPDHHGGDVSTCADS